MIWLRVLFGFIALAPFVRLSSRMAGEALEASGYARMNGLSRDLPKRLTFYAAGLFLAGIVAAAVVQLIVEVFA